MSIFEGWDPGQLKAMFRAASGSPEILLILAGVGLFCLLLVGFAVLFTVHHITGFYARVREEEELARLEEEQAEKERAEAKAPAAQNVISDPNSKEELS